MVLTNENIGTVPLDGNHARVIVLGEDAQMTSEDKAMLCALYSRSNDSVVSHLSRVKDSGSSNFMSQYYVGYGHASIADCGNVYVFFENVSIVAAMCINNFELFNGQECSTRYINFDGDISARVVLTDQSRAVYDAAMSASTDTGMEGQGCDEDPMSADQYIGALFELYGHVRTAAMYKLRQHLLYHGSADGGVVDPSAPAVKRAIEARAFDIARGWLPAGVKTNVALVCSLRKAREHMMLLTTYPQPEVRELAREALRSLHEAYPSSFEEPTDENIAAYCARHGIDGLQVPAAVFVGGRQYPSVKNGGRQFRATGGSAYSTTFARASLHAFDARIERVQHEGDGSGYDHVAVDFATFFESGESALPLKSKAIARVYDLPADLMPVSVTGVLDYGSYRDLARHRTLYKGHVSPFMQHAMAYHYDSVTDDEVVAKFYKYDKFCTELGVRPAPFELDLFEDRALKLQALIEKKLRRLIAHAAALLRKFSALYAAYDYDSHESQAEGKKLIEQITLLDYFAPLAMPVQVSFVTMPAHLSYFIVLRSSQAVHPTLRKFVYHLSNSLSSALSKDNYRRIVPSEFQAQVYEQTEAVWLPRGNQTIIKKEKEEQ